MKLWQAEQNSSKTLAKQIFLPQLIKLTSANWVLKELTLTNEFQKWYLQYFHAWRDGKYKYLFLNIVWLTKGNYLIQNDSVRPPEKNFKNIAKIFSKWACKDEDQRDGLLSAKIYIIHTRHSRWKVQRNFPTKSLVQSIWLANSPVTTGFLKISAIILAS